MKKRFRFLLLSSMLVGGAIAGSFYLIPTPQERALTSYKDKEFVKARELYEQQFEQGNLSLDTVMHLVGVYLQYAEVEKAIEVMEAYIEKNPNHLEARRELGRLYQYGQRPEDYLRNLEIINQLAASSDDSRKLITAYKVSQADEKNIPLMISRLMDEKQGNPQEFRDLIRLLATGKRYVEALEVHEEFRTRYPNDLQFTDHELAMRLYGDLGKQKEMIEYGLSLKETNLKPVEISRISNILLYQGNPDIAYEFISAYEQQALEDDTLFGQYLTILTNTNREKKAYGIALEHYNQGKLAARHYDELMLLASQFGNQPLYEEVREQVAYDALDENEVIVMIQLALSQQDTMLLDYVRPRAETLAADKDDFYLKAILLVALNDTAQAEAVTEVMRGETVFSRRLQLASMCAPRKFGGCVDAFVETLPPMDSMSDREVVAVTQILQQQKRYADAFHFINQARESRESAAIEEAWFPLAARESSTGEIASYLQRGEQLSDKAYRDGFFLAMEAQHYDTAIMIAEHLVALEKTPEHQDYAMQAYMSAKRYDEALPMLRAVRGDSAEKERDYLFVLSKLAKKNPTFANELADYSMEVLENNPSQQRRLAVIYAMVEAGQQHRIMPYVYDLALQNPKEWAFLYADYLKKTTGGNAVTDFWLEVAARHPQDITLQTQIAYNVLEAGNEEAAMQLFKKLAANEAPDSPVVSQLLYLWAPLYPEAGIEWLGKRAEAASTPQEKLEWLKRMATGSSDDQLLALAPRYPEMLALPDVEDRYLDALSRNTPPAETASVMESYLRPRVDTVQTVQPLLRYAQFANGYRLPELEERAYLKALEISPENPIVLGKLGTFYHGKADYSRSYDVLSRYFEQDLPMLPATAEAYRPHFVMAELHRRNREIEKAKPYYKEIVAAGSGADDKDVEFHSMAARSLAYGGFEKEGLAIFERILAANPHDRQLKADYSALLVELKKPEATLASLPAWREPASQLTAPALEPVSLSELNASAYKLMDGNRRLLLVHGSDTEQKAMPASGKRETEAMSYRIAELENQPWIGYGIEGKQETMLVAEPGYRFEIMQTNQGALWLHPVADVESPQQALLNEEYVIQNELIQARVEVETGEGYDSGQRVRKLVKQHPQNPQVLGFAANVENFIGNWAKARQLVNKAHDLQPDNEDIIALQRSIERRHAANVYIDGEWRALGTNDEYITSVGGSYDVNEQVQLGMEVQNNDVRSDVLRLPDGRSGAFNVERQRAEVFARYFHDDGAQSQVSLFANNDTAGLGGYHSFANPLGYTNLGIEFQRPYWEFVEGTIDDATRNRVHIGHRYSPDNIWIFSGELGANQYNTAYEDNVSSTVSFAGAAVRRIHELPYIAVGYGLDAEYETSEKNGRDVNGIPFQRFPFDSREVHSVNVFANHDFSMDTNAEGFVGFGFDRMTGDAGPAGEARLTHYLTDRLSVQGRAIYGFRGGAAQGELARLGVRLQYRY